MKRLAFATLAITLAAAVGCGKGLDLGYGDMSVEYDFDGVEVPDKVSLWLIEATDGQKCNNLDYQPESGIREWDRNLPIEGNLDWNEIPDDTLWIVFAVGSRNNGVRVAEACRDNIRVRNGKWTDVNLTLDNVPLGLDGSFYSDVNLDMQPPGQMMTILIAFDIACQAAGLGDPTCAISTGLGNLMADLDVGVRWDLDQRHDALRGEMTWVTIEGVDVGPEWKITEGGFNAEIPGATEARIVSNDMRVHMDQLVLFMLQEVMKVDLKDYTDQVQLVMEHYVSDLELLDGSAEGIDNNFDGSADVVLGEIDVELTFPEANVTHQFDMDWYSLRI